MLKRILLRVVSPIVLSLVGALLALALFHWLADEMLEGATLDFDEAVRAFVHRFASPVLTTVMSGISSIASLPTVLMGCVVACALLVWKQRRAEALGVLITVAGAAFLTWDLKLLFHRERPEPYFGIPVPPDFSFPSGHALMAFCFCAALAIAARRKAAWVAAALVALGVGLSRIYLGVHYPSDILGGYLAGLIWILGVRFVALGRAYENPGTELR